MSVDLDEVEHLKDLHYESRLGLRRERAAYWAKFHARVDRWAVRILLGVIVSLPVLGVGMCVGGRALLAHHFRPRVTTLDGHDALTEMRARTPVAIHLPNGSGATLIENTDAFHGDFDAWGHMKLTPPQAGDLLEQLEYHDNGSTRTVHGSQPPAWWVGQAAPTMSWHGVGSSSALGGRFIGVDTETGEMYFYQFSY